MTGEIYATSTGEDFIWIVLIYIRNIVVGTVSVGLAMGACLLTHFLYRLTTLPKESR